VTIDWTDLPARQQPPWPDPAAVAPVVAELAALPPLVFAGECDDLRDRLARAARGESFLLQGGDCAETFAGATADAIRKRIKTVLQMAVILQYAAGTPVVKMGRMAGQFAKPRSRDTETREGVTLPAYRGDAVNDYAFTASARACDPRRLLRAYHTSAATLNLIRAFTTGGFASLAQVHEWNRGFTSGKPAYQQYEAVAREISRAVRFMESAGANFEEFRRVDLFSSHEALLLDYERPLVRIDSRTGHPYATSAHFVWVGERTRQPDGAHLDLAARIRNPVGVKLGPSTTPDDAVALVERLNPGDEAGRLTFITRMGAARVREVLPPIVQKVQGLGGRAPLWVCDPMHGNTFESTSGYKTRRFDDVVDEVRGFFEVHDALGTVPGGLHIELTGDDVTECLGGGAMIDDAALATRYESVCDPRLNHEQSLELAFLVGEMLDAARERRTSRRT
jgi:3-deoxy-7-phosphoheptulonate synthase